MIQIFASYIRYIISLHFVFFVICVVNECNEYIVGIYIMNLCNEYISIYTDSDLYY